MGVIAVHPWLLMRLVVVRRSVSSRGNIGQSWRQGEIISHRLSLSLSTGLILAGLCETKQYNRQHHLIVIDVNVGNKERILDLLTRYILSLSLSTGLILVEL